MIRKRVFQVVLIVLTFLLIFFPVLTFAILSNYLTGQYIKSVAVVSLLISFWTLAIAHYAVSKRITHMSFDEINK